MSWKAFFTVLFLTAIISLALGDECSAGTTSTDGFDVGTATTLGDRENIRNDAVFINPNEKATCNGTVYGWNYCFDPQNRRSSQVFSIAMFRPYTDGTYRLVEGSFYQYVFDDNFHLLECGNITLSQPFAVQEDDVVGICEESDTVWYYEKQGSTLMRWDTGGCSEMRLRNERSEIRNEDNRIFLLSALIDVDECSLRETDCHENALCSNVLGGVDSYYCTCKPGFTGDGFTSCVAIDMGTDGTTDNVSDMMGTSNPTSGESDSGRSNSDDSGPNGGVVAAIVVVILILVILAVAAGLVGLVLYRKRRLVKQEITPQTTVSTGIDNGVYAKPYEMMPESDTTPYEIPQESLRKDRSTLLHFRPELAYAPNGGINIYASPDEPIENGDSSFIYEIPEDIYEQTVAAENIYESASPYECPADDEAGIYAQISSNQIMTIARNNIRILSHLGSGQFGNVNKAEWNNGRRQLTVAVKTLTDNDATNRVKFLQEAAIMAQFRHPNILTLHGVVSDGDPKMIVVELMNDGDLKEYLTRMRPDPGQLVTDSVPKQLLNFSKQVALGLHYLSCRGFVHRDLAARNILVHNMHCKIADFGMSRDLADDDIYVSHGGVIPVRWTAPEALSHKCYSTASDVWSYGCVLYEIWSLGHKPFETIPLKKILSLVNKGYRLPPPPGCPKTVYKLMIDTWHPEVSRRLQSRDVLKGLLGPAQDVLAIPSDDIPTDNQAAVLGAPIDKGKHLYQELQNTYI